MLTLDKLKFKNFLQESLLQVYCESLFSTSFRTGKTGEEKLHVHQTLEEKKSLQYQSPQ